MRGKSSACVPTTSGIPLRRPCSRRYLHVVGGLLLDSRRIAIAGGERKDEYCGKCQLHFRDTCSRNNRGQSSSSPSDIHSRRLARRLPIQSPCHRSHDGLQALALFQNAAHELSAHLHFHQPCRDEVGHAVRAEHDGCRWNGACGGCNPPGEDSRASGSTCGQPELEHAAQGNAGRPDPLVQCGPQQVEFDPAGETRRGGQGDRSPARRQASAWAAARRRSRRRGSRSAQVSPGRSANGDFVSPVA